MLIRVSRGVGSNPKLWGMLYGDGYSRQVMELDCPPAPLTAILWGPYDAVGGPMSWPSPYGPLGLTSRKRYAGVDAVVAELAALWPAAEIVRADDEPLGRL
jgi:hypothetical protein